MKIYTLLHAPTFRQSAMAIVQELLEPDFDSRKNACGVLLDVVLEGAIIENFLERSQH